MNNFILKKWLLYTVTFFIILLLVSIIWNYFDNEESVSGAFTNRELVKGLIVSLLIGYLMAKWVVRKKKV